MHFLFSVCPDYPSIHSYIYTYKINIIHNTYNTYIINTKQLSGTTVSKIITSKWLCNTPYKWDWWIDHYLKTFVLKHKRQVHFKKKKSLLNKPNQDECRNETTWKIKHCVDLRGAAVVIKQLFDKTNKLCQFWYVHIGSYSQNRRRNLTQTT